MSYMSRSLSLAGCNSATRLRMLVYMFCVGCNWRARICGMPMKSGAILGDADDLVVIRPERYHDLDVSLAHGIVKRVFCFFV